MDRLRSAAIVCFALCVGLLPAIGRAADASTQAIVDRAAEMAVEKVAEVAPAKDELKAKRPDEWRGPTKVSFIVFVLDVEAIDDAKVDQWPDSCEQAGLSKRSHQSVAKVQAEISAHLSEISTSFRISDCDADLLAHAAHSIVYDQLDEQTLARLKTSGISVHPARIGDVPLE
jgi:hypothetical protein